jgi:hypothetical protein
MTPAAYHRQTSPFLVTDRFIRVASRLMLCSMVPLALAIALDCYLVGSLIMGERIAAIIALGVLSVMMSLWFALPRLGVEPHGSRAALLSPTTKESPHG